MVVQTTVSDAAVDFAWIIPLPAAPLESPVVLNDPSLFEWLDERTEQTEVRVVDARGLVLNLPRCGFPVSPIDPKEDVEVISVEVLNCSGSTGAPVGQWLENNGYVVAPALEKMTKRYCEEDWVFLILEISNPDQYTYMRLPALLVRWEGNTPVYPQVLTTINATDEDTDLVLYVAAPERVEASSMETTYAGRVDFEAHGEWSTGDFHGEILTEEMVEDLDGYWITRLEGTFAPDPMVDLYPEPVDSVPYRPESQYHTESGWTRHRPGLGCLAIIVLGALLLVAMRVAGHREGAD